MTRTSLRILLCSFYMILILQMSRRRGLKVLTRCRILDRHARHQDKHHPAGLWADISPGLETRTQEVSGRNMYYRKCSRKQGKPYVICASLHADVAFVEDRDRAVVQNHVDRAFEDDAKVDALRAVGDVDVIRRRSYSGNFCEQSAEIRHGVAAKYCFRTTTVSVKRRKLLLS
jgi:hypothetical protein